MSGLPLFRWTLPGLVGVLSVGCAGARIYSADMELQSRRVVQVAGTAPTEDAREVVKAATTIAFYPPDSCTDVKAAGAGATEVSNVMRLQCGVLMTELEAAASRAGFSVVSWQTLRRTADTRTIDYARDNKVDLLFEVNELSFDIPVQEQWAFTNMSFRQADAAGGGGRPLVVNDTMATARRCQDQYWKTAQPVQSATLDVKLVSVADGRMRWTYRNTRAERSDERLRVTRSWSVQPSRSSNPLLPFGALGMGLGLGFILAPELINDGDAQFKQAFQTIGIIGVAAGAVAIVASFFIPPDYARADDVLCVGPALEDQEAPRAATSTAGTSVAFTEQQVSGAGDAEQRRKELLNAVIREFIETVSAMRK